jgi:protein XRP2
MVDFVNNSEVVLGPSTNSVFIRNCDDSNFVIAVKQLRIRDCHNLKIMLYAQTAPVIESSSNLTFIPHTYHYRDMFE